MVSRRFGFPLRLSGAVQSLGLSIDYSIRPTDLDQGLHSLLSDTDPSSIKKNSSLSTVPSTDFTVEDESDWTPYVMAQDAETERRERLRHILSRVHTAATDGFRNARREAELNPRSSILNGKRVSRGSGRLLELK